MNNTIDTINEGAYITTELMDKLQFTNAYRCDRLVAVYAQQASPNDYTKYIQLTGVAAGVSLDSFYLEHNYIPSWNILNLLDKSANRKEFA